MRPLPDALRRLVDEWEAEQRVGQHGFKWPRGKWLDRLPEHRSYLETLPIELDRACVIKRSADADRSPTSALHAYLTMMAWGMGTSGYGWWRTQRILTANDSADPARWLQTAAQISREHGGPAAFSWSAQHRLKFFGPAFVTKYLYFCAPERTTEPALILDRLVGAWLARNAGWKLSAGWRTDYPGYVRTMTHWADDLSAQLTHSEKINPQDLEFLIFRNQARISRSPTWQGSPTGDESARNGGEGV